jgi:hypothetical protein
MSGAAMAGTRKRGSGRGWRALRADHRAYAITGAESAEQASLRRFSTRNVYNFGRFGAKGCDPTVLSAQRGGEVSAKRALPKSTTPAYGNPHTSPLYEKQPISERTP